MKKGLVIIGGAVIGLLISIGISYWIKQGYGVRWRQLPTPPGEVIELVPAGDDYFNAVLFDGTYWWQNGDPNADWKQVTAGDFITEHSEAYEPCDTTKVEFSRIVNPPENIQDCLQVQLLYADGLAWYAFILDDNGQVWQWGRTRTGYMAMWEVICLPALGLSVGAAVGTIVAETAIKRKKKKEPVVS